MVAIVTIILISGELGEKSIKGLEESSSDHPVQTGPWLLVDKKLLLPFYESAWRWRPCPRSSEGEKVRLDTQAPASKPSTCNWRAMLATSQWHTKDRSAQDKTNGWDGQQPPEPSCTFTLPTPCNSHLLLKGGFPAAPAHLRGQHYFCGFLLL